MLRSWRGRRRLRRRRERTRRPFWLRGKWVLCGAVGSRGGGAEEGGVVEGRGRGEEGEVLLREGAEVQRAEEGGVK